MVCVSHSVWNENSECIYSYLFLDCHYLALRSEMSLLAVVIFLLLSDKKPSFYPSAATKKPPLFYWYFIY